MFKNEIITRYLRDIIWYVYSESEYKLGDLFKVMDHLVEENAEDLIIWYDLQISKIEDSWKIKLSDLFVHCNWDKDKQKSFLVQLLSVCSGTDDFPENEFYMRKDLRGARSYFKKPLLPERPMYIDIYEGYLESFFSQLLKQYELNQS